MSREPDQGDPCQGCMHLRTERWPRRPECALDAQYGDRQCQRRTVQTGAPRGWVERSETQRHAAHQHQARRRG